MSRFSRGELVAALCGVALFVSSFVPGWAIAEAEGTDVVVRFDPWSVAFATLPRAAIALGALAALVAGARRLDRLPAAIDDRRAYLWIGAIATALMVAATIAGPLGSGSRVRVVRGPLLYAGVVLAAGIAVGGYLHARLPSGTRDPRCGGPVTPPS